MLERGHDFLFRARAVEGFRLSPVPLPHKSMSLGKLSRGPLFGSHRNRIYMVDSNPDLIYVHDHVLQNHTSISSRPNCIEGEPSIDLFTSNKEHKDTLTNLC